MILDSGSFDNQVWGTLHKAWKTDVNTLTDDNAYREKFTDNYH